MKLFISHSWKNKIWAQKIADEFKSLGMDVWLDAVNLLPGQIIQESIDSVLKDIDIVVLVWSKEAEASDGVAAEIQTCQNLQKIIVPCFMDDALLQNHPYLKNIKGIGFQDFSNGLNRLKMVVLNYMSKDFNMQHNDGIKEMNEFLGIIETTNHLIFNQNIKFSGTEEEKEYWITKIKEVEQNSYAKLKNEETIGNEIMQFLNEKMPILEANLNNKEIVQTILSEMESHQYAAKPQMKVIIDHVVNIAESFNSNETTPADNESSDQTAYTNQDEMYPEKENFYKNEWLGIELQLPPCSILNNYNNGIDVEIHGHGLASIGFIYHFYTDVNELETHIQNYIQTKANKNVLLGANPIQLFTENAIGTEMVYYNDENIAISEFQCGFILDNNRGVIMQIYTKDESVTKLYTEFLNSLYVLPHQAPHYEPDVETTNWLKNKKFYYIKSNSYSDSSFEDTKYYKLFENNVFHYHFYSRSYSSITGSIISEKNYSGYWGTYKKNGEIQLWFKWHDGTYAIHPLIKSNNGTYLIGSINFYLVDINY